MTDTTEKPSENDQNIGDSADSEKHPAASPDYSTISRNGEVSVFGSNVFLVDETAFRSSIPKISHWSIAWSDLMMTMFILFLSMFVYQAAHKEFLVSDEREVIGGDTTEALAVNGHVGSTFPFVPIQPARPIMSGGSVKKVEPISIQDITDDTPFFDEESNGGLDRIRESFKREQQKEETDDLIEPSADMDKNNLMAAGSQRAYPESTSDQAVDKIFTLSTDKISELGLDNFAAIDLVPDQTMRIILTGDLLFDTGEAELSRSSKSSLLQIADIIKDTPYMINVVGHTDNVPMHSEKYATNWELSVARASIVARCLVEEMGMNPQQFVVSGYSSFRPIKPNTNARNRAINRRVEIIISKRLPAPVLANAENLK